MQIIYAKDNRVATWPRFKDLPEGTLFFGKTLDGKMDFKLGLKLGQRTAENIFMDNDRKRLRTTGYFIDPETEFQTLQRVDITIEMHEIELNR